MAKEKWYIAGLHFECQQCGNCCSGPEQGYVWLVKPEIELLADRLRLPAGQFCRSYCRRVGVRTSLLEQADTNDCIFLQGPEGQKGCVVYDLRPSQCRNWPFWADNLKTPDHWNEAAQGCPGINRGKFYSYEQIERLRKRKKWWQHDRQEPDKHRS